MIDPHLESAILDAVVHHGKDVDPPFELVHVLDHVQRSGVLGYSWTVLDEHAFLDAIDDLLRRQIIAWGARLLPAGTPLAFAPWLRVGAKGGVVLVAHRKRRAEEEKARRARAAREVGS